MTVAVSEPSGHHIALSTTTTRRQPTSKVDPRRLPCHSVQHSGRCNVPWPGDLTTTVRYKHQSSGRILRLHIPWRSTSTRALWYCALYCTIARLCQDNDGNHTTSNMVKTSRKDPGRFSNAAVVTNHGATCSIGQISTSYRSTAG